jgi:hypothetical protein
MNERGLIRRIEHFFVAGRSKAENLGSKIIALDSGF